MSRNKKRYWMCRSAHQDDQVMNLIGIIRIFWKILIFCGETCFCNYSVICLKNQMIVMCNILLYIYICPFFFLFFFFFSFTPWNFGLKGKLFFSGLQSQSSDLRNNLLKATTWPALCSGWACVKTVQQAVITCGNCSHDVAGSKALVGVQVHHRPCMRSALLHRAIAQASPDTPPPPHPWVEEHLLLQPVWRGVWGLVLSSGPCCASALRGWRTGQWFGTVWHRVTATSWCLCPNQEN